MPLDGLELDPGIIGPNVSAARRRLAITQAELARQLGISRPILIAIESGQRAPSSDQLARLSTLLAARVRDLVTLPAVDDRSSVRFRDPMRTGDDASDAVASLMDFGRYYLHLEDLVGKKIRPRSVPAIALDNEEDVGRLAEDMAAAERARLSLGDGPLLDLRAVLEQDAGILVFGLDSFASTNILGLFSFSSDLALVAFNVMQPDPRRQRWTLAHEYAHYLTNRYDAEITYDQNSGKRYRDKHEIFAEVFAMHFLMPGTGVSRRFSDLVGGSGQASVANILILANQFRVSFQAMCQRLEGMGRIPRHTYDHVMNRGFRPLEAERSLGIERKDGQLDRYPLRYTYMISALCRSGSLSEGDAATYLQADRLTAREILNAFGSPGLFPVDAPLETPS